MEKGMLFFVAIAFSTLLSFGQGGAIKGKILDKKNKPVPFANIVLLQDGIEKNAAQANFEGEYSVSKIPAGTYTVQISFVGFDTFILEGLIVQDGKVGFLDDVILSNETPNTNYKRKRFFRKKK